MTIQRDTPSCVPLQPRSVSQSRRILLTTRICYQKRIFTYRPRPSKHPSHIISSRRSPFIDEAWHAHILCTKDHRKFCNEDVFGNFPRPHAGHWRLQYDALWKHQEYMTRSAKPSVSLFRKSILVDIWPTRAVLTDILMVGGEGYSK